MGLAITMIALLAGLAACVPVQYLSFVFNWKQTTEARALVFTFAATALITAPFIASFFGV